MDNLYEKLSKERKQLQENGEAPDFFTTGGYQLFVKKYLHEAKTPREQYSRIAKTLAKHAPKDSTNWEEAFFNIMWEGWVSLSSPVLANTGTKRGLVVSCSGNVVPNDVYKIYDSRAEVATLTKYGFGTASYLGDIATRGTISNKGVVCSGVVPVVKGFVEDMRYVSQGSNRRGAWAGYIEITHGDFWELVHYLETDPDDLNIGWIVHQTFIDKLNAGDAESVKRFQEVMKVKMTTGKGYFFFPEKANNLRPQMYVDKGLEIVAPQLCVAPETKVLTDKGHIEIQSLENQYVNVWNGEEWSNVKIVKTSERSQLIKVVTKDGYILECTPQHKFYKSIRVAKGNKVVEVEAKDLKAGDKLIKFKLPLIEGSKTLEHAYANGFYTGGGCLVGNEQRLYFYGAKKQLEKYCGDIFHSRYDQVNQDRVYCHTNKLKEKFFVPDCSYTVESRLEWFAGLLDSDGTVVFNGKTQNLQVGSIEEEFLKEVQLMLQTLGVSSKVTKNIDEGMRLLPANDGTGENKLFSCKSAYRLLIGNYGVTKLQSLGLKTYRLKMTNHVPNRECSHFVKVKEVVNEGRVDATFCFTEPKRHMGVFNGILTGQCNEIMLHSSEDYTYTCVLSSMNLAKWDEWKNTNAVFVATVMLDCVVSEFLEQADGVKGLERAVAFTKAGRALGLGACGFHTYLQEHMMPFGGFETHLWNIEVFKHMAEESKKASEYLATLLGEPEWCKGYGVRNTHRLAVAPTKSTALIMGGISEGINPDPAMTYTQLTPAGEVDRANPALLKLMKDKGVYDKKHFSEIVENQGSVQSVGWLTPEEKAVFKTAFEINQKDILRLAAARQKYIDQGQSLNLFFSSDENEDYIAEVHQEAFENPMILGLYYCYSKAGVVASKGECTACQ